ncbi:CsgG/HfaB family protein [Cerasicoccus arenae]|uniref:Curli production assembly/transport component CsgG n=1 Tax=Cerasicoccus arenae TaxID=424488 RepID=A0A8J3DBN4_9BACT|nr:CsgG/HfaB family protein [Cerasicoccus arenae]MBK1859957.1 hypothetical protein [Cerasicoccus arenae]GHC01477.1 hypothetical protein GCM10007047_17450 [Cerasicoccus arenae]
MKLALSALAFLSLALTTQADKPTLAITPVNVSPAVAQSKANPDEKVALPQVVEALQGQLINAFGQTGKFTVVSRTDLPPVISEQVLGQSGNLDSSSAAKQGKIAGASYVLVVGIDFFNLYTERANFASIARSQVSSILRINAVSRLYDATTGALIASDSTTVNDQDFQQYFAFAEREGNLETVVYLQAARALAEQIATNLTNDLYPAKVVAKSGKQITINQGSANGLTFDNSLVVYAVGAPMTDPDTGAALGQEEILLGYADLVRIDERTSIAMLKEDNGVERGHIVRFE